MNFFATHQKSLERKVEYRLFSLFSHLLPSNKFSQQSSSVGIVGLTCHQHVKMLMYTLNSFFYQLGYSLPAFFVSDGTLTTADKKLLQKHFTITIVEHEWCDKKMKKLLKKETAFSRYRFGAIPYTRYKFDAILHAPFERIICMDSDVLFYKSPTEIKNWIESNSNFCLYNAHEWSHLNKDRTLVDLEHSFRVMLQKYAPYGSDPEFNAGVMCLPKKEVLSLSKLDKIFKLFRETEYDRNGMADETALSFLFCSWPQHRALTKDKYVVTPYELGFQQGVNKKAVCIHYAHETKSRFFADARKLAQRTQFFRAPATELNPLAI